MVYSPFLHTLRKNTILGFAKNFSGEEKESFSNCVMTFCLYFRKLDDSQKAVRINDVLLDNPYKR